MTHIIGDDTGWLRVKLDASKTIIALPEYLQVDLTNSKNGRDFFTILEGVHKGKKHL